MTKTQFTKVATGKKYHDQFKSYRGSATGDCVKRQKHAVINKRTTQKSNYKERQLNRLGSMLLKNGHLTIAETEQLVSLS